MFFGGPDYESSADSTGLRFDGINDYIFIEENVIPDSGDHTISVWLKADLNNNGNRTILSQSDTSGSPFYFGSSSKSDSVGTIKMNDDWDALKDTEFLLDNNWHYYTIVTDGTIGDSSNIIDTSSFYIDGELITQVMGSGKSYPKDESFFIATMWDSSGEYFSGLIDEVSIWDRKLSSEEIRQLYNSGAGADPTFDTLDYTGSSNLIGFWPFNEGADSSVSDYSGNGYDGQIIGASWEKIDNKMNLATIQDSLMDSDLNTYVYDINGDYVSFTINIGKRAPKTNFLGSQRFTIDLLKNNNFPSMIIKSQNTQEFKGKKFSISKIGETNILDTDISKSFLFSRNEIILPKSKLAMIWFQYKKNLEGHDPRGNNVKIDKEIGMENILKFIENSSFKNKINVHDYSIDSKVYPERKRDIFGFWNDFTWQIKLKNKIDLVLGLISGVDKGLVNGKSFNAKGVGLKTNIIFYFKQNGRLQTEVSFVNVQEENNFDILPPEVLKGYAYGQSLKTSTRLQYLLNQSLTFNLNLNTINNMRYKNMITLQGEIRAYF